MIKSFPKPKGSKRISLFNVIYLKYIEAVVRVPATCPKEARDIVAGMKDTHKVIKAKKNK